MNIRLSAVTLSPMEEPAVRTKLLPGLYIGMVAAKASKAEKRRELQVVSTRLLAEFDVIMAIAPDFAQRRRKELFAAAKESRWRFSGQVRGWRGATGIWRCFIVAHIGWGLRNFVR